MIDDRSLFHGTYDPVKAREYYLRTRKLKGRKPGVGKATGQGRDRGQSKSVAVRGNGKPNRADTKSRRAELEAQKVALEKRLERLREVLAEKVAAAKKRSGVQQPKKDGTDTKDAAPETPSDKADRNDAEKKAKPLTATQKSAKAKQAKEAYEKEHPNSLSEDVAVLKDQVKDIQAKIKKAITDAQEQKIKAGTNITSLVQPKPKPNDGPRGR